MKEQLSFICYNVRKKATILDATFHTPEIKNVDLVLVQEPPAKYTPPPGWTALLPYYPQQNDDNDENYSQLIRATTFIRNSIDPKSIQQVATPPILRGDKKGSDIVALDLKVQEGSEVKTIRLVNVYNQKDGALGSLAKVMEKTPTGAHLLVCGDLNLHHPEWEQKTDAPDEYAEMGKLTFDAAGLVHLLPFNTITYRVKDTKSAIDLVMGNTTAAGHVVSCKITDEFDHNSDHLPIVTTLSFSTSETPGKGRLLWSKLNVFTLKEEYLAGAGAEAPLETGADLDTEAGAIRDELQTAIKKAVPLARPSKYSKPWWNGACTRLIAGKRHWKRPKGVHPSSPDGQLYTAMRAKLDREFTAAVESAKAEHEAKLLESVNDRNIWNVAKKLAGESTHLRTPPLKTSPTAKHAAVSVQEQSELLAHIHLGVGDGRRWYEQVAALTETPNRRSSSVSPTTSQLKAEAEPFLPTAKSSLNPSATPFTPQSPPVSPSLSQHIDEEYEKDPEDDYAPEATKDTAEEEEPEEEGGDTPSPAGGSNATPPSPDPPQWKDLSDQEISQRTLNWHLATTPSTFRKSHSMFSLQHRR